MFHSLSGIMEENLDAKVMPQSHWSILLLANIGSKWKQECRKKAKYFSGLQKGQRFATGTLEIKTQKLFCNTKMTRLTVFISHFLDCSIVCDSRHKLDAIKWKTS